jgi:hypothetical protein
VDRFQLCGLKYNTIPAPAAVNKNPRYSSGLTEDFGGCITIVVSTLTSGAKPNTIGIT